MGQKWSINWFSYITDYGDTPGYEGYNVSRHTGGGGAFLQSGYNTTTGRFTSEIEHSGSLQRIPATGAVTSWVMTQPDGSKETYQRQTASTSDRKFFLTQRTDPQGNSVSLSYTNYTGTFTAADGSTINCTAGCVKLSSITDAKGKVTTFTYGHPSDPLLITAVTDPFGRGTTLTYTTPKRQLASITDPIGITSTVAYDAGGSVNALSTPYGTTTFAYDNGTDATVRWLTITDPLNYTERTEFNSFAPGVGYADTPAVLPAGLYTMPTAPTNQWYSNFRTTYYFDKHVLPLAQPTPGGSIDYYKAYIRHWLHNNLSPNFHAPVLESERAPLENRVWYNYAGQPTRTDRSAFSGASDQPTATGRVLDDGSTQLTTATYNISSVNSSPPVFVPISNGALLSKTDALGRKTIFNYDSSNMVDLTSIQQQVSSGPTYETLAAFTYNSQHLPLTHTDAAGQLWQYAYNAAGQMTYATNPLGQTRFWEYDSSGRITRITTPVAVAYASVAYGTTNVSAPTAQSFNYTTPCSGVAAPANTNLPISVTDSEGYTLCYQYDALDRVTKVKYPDGTTDTYDYNFPTGWIANGINYGGTPSLDVWKVTDRLGRIVNYSYDRNRQLISKSETVKVAGSDVMRTTGYSYYENGVLKELTDANGAVTHWEIDIQSRPTSKTYAYGTPDAKTETYSYENTTSRLKSITDARGQTVTYTYNKDNTIASYAYTNAVVATAGASFIYDPWYPRRMSMTDQYGTTTWSYRAVLTNGALNLDTEDGPFTSNDTITYTYDAAGRVASRQIAGATDSLVYDVLGRVQSHSVQDIAVFTYGYLGNSGQLASRTAVNLSTTLVTSYGYDTNANDRRLLTITNTGSAARNYSYTSNPYQITGLTETMPAGHPWTNQTRSYSYDASDRLLTATASTAGNKSYSYDKLDNATSFAGITGTYNNLNQINTFNGTSYTYDANGNLTSDGARTYTYDATDRLVRINYTGSTAKSEFGYDGLGRRVVLVETPATGSAVTSRYMWCGSTICQERDGSNTVTKRYYAGEGERRPATFESYAYMTDHLGSVREMVGMGSAAVKFAYDYDAYGSSERTWTNTTTGYSNMRYAGLFYHPTSGLYLSATRAYNPANGKWLNVDPIREAGGINLTGYVGASPTMGIDPDGLAKAKIGGRPIVVHKNDIDPWPSNPHGHIYDKNQVIDLEGNIYNKSNGALVDSLSKRELAAWLKFLKGLGKLCVVGDVITFFSMVYDACRMSSPDNPYCYSPIEHLESEQHNWVGGFSPIPPQYTPIPPQYTPIPTEPPARPGEIRA